MGDGGQKVRPLCSPTNKLDDTDPRYPNKRMILARAIAAAQRCEEEIAKAAVEDYSIPS